MKKLLPLAILVLALPVFAEESPKERLQKKVSVNFEETKFREVIAYFSAYSKIDITVDSTLKGLPPVTMAVTDVSTRDALNLVLALVNPKLKWDFRWGGIFIGLKERLELLPKEVPGEAPGLDSKVNVDFAETALPQVVKFFGSFSGAKIVIDRAAAARAEETLVSIKCNNATLRDALSRIVFPANLALVIEDKQIKIVPAMTKKHESKEDAVKRAVKETKVNLNFESTPIEEVATFLASYAGINIYLDPMLSEERSEDELRVTLRADDVTIENALQLVTLTKGFASDYRWGGIFLATAARLKDLSKAALAPAGDEQPAWEKKLRKQLTGNITFSFDEATIVQAAEFIRTLKGVNIVFTPEARREAEGLALTLTVNDISLANALALMTVPYGLKIELKSEVVLISVAE